MDMYDNASNMSGTYSGVQARFHQVNPLAEWVPCAAHSLHLVGAAAAESCTDAVRFLASFSDFTHSCQPRHRGGRNC